MKGSYSDLWQAIARTLPDRTAIRDASGETWTYARFARDAGAFAASLAEHGVRPGDTLALLLYNRPEFLIAFFACLAAGITPVPLNYRLREGEVSALLDDSNASALIYPTSLTVVARAAAGRSDHEVALITVTDDDTPDAPGAAWADTVAREVPLPPSSPASGELWIYTGGTTGLPKAVRWNAAEMFEAQMFPTYALSGLAYPETMGEAVRIASDPATPRIVNLPLTPFLHGTALTTSLNTLTLGGTVLVTSSARLDAERAVRFANEAGATRIIVAGDAVALPLAEATERLGSGLATVTSIMSSGMRFSPETKHRLHAVAELSIFDVLASSEGGAFALTTTTTVADLPGRPKLLPTAVVLDNAGNEVQDDVGSVGVLAQRGALPLDYHGDREKTAEAFREINGVRYVVPGDWVRVEDDRHIEFLGRGSGVINTGGEKVYPLEVEEALLTHPAVADAVVLGVPDRRFGEIVTAVVEFAAAGVPAEELSAHVDVLLAGYKRPRHFLVRASIDRSPTGKVDIARLRDEVIADRSTNRSGG